MGARREGGGGRGRGRRRGRSGWRGGGGGGDGVDGEKMIYGELLEKCCGSGIAGVHSATNSKDQTGCEFEANTLSKKGKQEIIHKEEKGVGRICLILICNEF